MEQRKPFTLPNWTKTFGLSFLLFLAMFGIYQAFWVPPCGRIAFGAECPVGSTSVFSNNIGLQGNTTNTLTLTPGTLTANATLTFPTSIDHIVARNTTDTLTNKTVTSPDINGGTWNGTIDAVSTATSDVTFNDNVRSTYGTGGDADFYYDGTNLILDPQVVGTGDFHILNGSVIAKADRNVDFSAQAYSDTASRRGSVQLKRARGTEASPTALQSGDRVGEIVFEGYGSVFHNLVFIRAVAAENLGASNRGGDLEFYTAVAASNAQPVRRWMIHDDGGLTETTLASQGVGTINAKAVYDDGALLTDYVSDAYLGQLTEGRLVELDALVPDDVVLAEKDKDGKITKPKKHDPAREFKQRGNWVFDPVQLGQYFLDNGNLPQITSESEWVAGERGSVGENIQRLTELVEILVLQNYDMAQEIDALQAQVSELSSP